MGVAIRGRERLDHPSGSAGGRGGARGGRRGIAQAKGVRRAAPRREHRRPARGSERACQTEDRGLEISTLDRGGGESPENSDRKDPAIQTARRRNGQAMIPSSRMAKRDPNISSQTLPHTG